MSPTSPSSTPAARPLAAPPRALVVVLTLNEAENLPRLLSRITQAVPQADILVIDDDSPDGTGRRAAELARREPRLRVHIRRGERGLGGALREGIRDAIEHDYDYLLNLDADLSHNPADLARLLSAATAGDESPDVVIGSRYLEEGGIEGWPWRRRLMSRMVNRFATLVLRLPVHDCSGSLRCYRVACLRKIDLPSLRCNGYAMLEELLLRLRAAGATMEEIPITFTDRQQGQSKLTSGEAMRSAWQLVRMALR